MLQLERMVKKLIYIIVELGLKLQAITLIFMLLAATGLEVLGVGIVLPVLLLLFNDQADTKMLNIGAGLIGKGRQLIGADSHDMIVIGFLILIVAYAIKAFFLSFLSFRQSYFTFLVQTRLSEKLFSKYLQMPYTDFIQRNSAIMIRNITNEISIFTNNAIFIGLSLLAELLVLVSIAILLLYIEPLGSLVALLSIGSVSICFRLLTRKQVSRWGRDRQTADGHRMAIVQQSLHGIKELRVFNKEEYAFNSFRQFDHQMADTWRKEQTLRQMPRIWLEFVAVGGLVTLAFIMMGSGMEGATLAGKLGIFAAAAFRLLPSMTRILNGLQSMRFGLPVINTLYDELMKQGSLNIKGASIETPVKRCQNGFICFENVSFSYPSSNHKCLYDITLNINEGECIGIIGSSGSGKSTLLDIIVGLLDPTHGRVLVDGKDISSSGHLQSWRNKIGYVSQHVYLFDDSIRNNVAFGVTRESQDEKMITSCLMKAQMSHFVNSLPNGIDEIIGDRGIRMSGGQRQRIGIARALYRNPSLLILDEGTSALDNMTERDLIEAIKGIKGQCTIIMVAHRLSTVAVCDRIIELENGAIHTVGAPNDILSGRAEQGL